MQIPDHTGLFLWAFYALAIAAFIYTVTAVIFR